MPGQELAPADEKFVTVSGAQDIVIESLVPLPYQRHVPHVTETRSRYRRLLVNPGGAIDEANGKSQRIIGAKELKRLYEKGRIVSAIELYHDLMSEDIGKTGMPALHNIFGGEFLMRAIDEEGKVLRPVQFIKAAIEAKLLNHISLDVLQGGCRIVKRIDDLHGPDMIVSGNMPKKMLQDPRLSQRIGDIIEATGCPLRKVYVEILENERIDNEAIDTLRPLTLSDDWLQIAVDDYPDDEAIDNLDLLEDSGIVPGMVKISGRHVGKLSYKTLPAMEGHIRRAYDTKTAIIVVEGNEKGISPEQIEMFKLLREKIEPDYEYPEKKWWVEGSTQASMPSYVA